MHHSKSNISFVNSYTQFITEYFENNPNDFWMGTFIYSRDRFHSPFLNTYESAHYDGKVESPYISTSFFLKTFIINTLRWKYNLFKNSVLILKAPKKTAPETEHPITVIKTFSYSHSFGEDGYADPFFGELKQFLLSRNKEVYYFIDCLNNPSEGFKHLDKKKNQFPFQSYNSIFDLISIALRTILAIFNIPKGPTKVNSCDLKTVLKRQYLCDIFNPIIMQGLLMSKAYARFSKSTRIESVYMTYENLNWEKIFQKAIKRVDSNTKVIGFQHAALPESCTNYYLSSDEKKHFPIPDKILTNGKVTKEILINYGNYEDSLVFTGAALRQSELIQKDSVPTKRKELLVALEGNLQCIDCLGFVVNQASELQDWKITVRMHPILPKDSLPKNLLEKIDSLKNINFSDNSSLKDDLSKAFVLVYWGTTVSLEALAMGLPAIHFNRGDRLSYDPAFQLKSNKYEVTFDSDLSSLLESIFSISDEEQTNLRTQAQNYISNYFLTVNEDNLESFLI